ncbi:MAG TPA: nitroreductase family protein [Sedimentisphaerales bacterium]|nr:nitroreductase family protein [Sedimentisphaerales bacterium]
MDFFDVVNDRHSYRGEFLPDKISREDLEKIVITGLLAPSGCNKQTTEFVIVDDEKLLEQIRELHTMPAVQTAVAVIICLIDRQPEPVYQNYSFQIEDCAAAVENILLAIAALGYASVWIDGALRVESKAERLCKIINAAPGKIARILLPVGKAAEKTSQSVKKSFAQRAFFNKYSK